MVAATDDPDLEQPKTRILGRGPTEEQQAQLEERLQKRSRVLCDSTGKTDVLCHDINTGDSPPICSTPYQIADKWREQVRGVLDGLCTEDMLVPSKRPWSSPIVPIPKKDGSVRVCVEYRKINKVTVLDPYCIPLVTDIGDRVADCQYRLSLILIRISSGSFGRRCANENCYCHSLWKVSIYDHAIWLLLLNN